MISSICIGIISYLPDDQKIREVRIKRLENLIKQCQSHFRLPIIIIAQNWKDYRLPQSDIMKVFLHENKLGITGARIKLREKFLESGFQYIIMLDDDMEMSENQIDYDYYLRMVKTYQREYYYVGNFLNNFSCISRGGFRKVNYDKKINPELGTGFEDWVFSEKCKKCLSSLKLESNLPNGIRRKFLDDEFSTWNPSDKKLNRINDTVSREIIKTIKKEVV